MNNEEKIIHGASCQRLLEDETLSDIMKGVRERQHGVFEDPQSTPEELSLARGIACGVNAILAELQRGVKNAEHIKRKME